MIRGTTPTHRFDLNISTTQIRDLRIYYAQDDQILVERTMADCELREKSVMTTLSQEETLKFVANKQVQVQIKVLTHEGTAMASSIKAITVGEILKDEVL